jgi:hypothetical protein
MPSIRDIFTFYLKAEHLQGRTAVVHIESCTIEQVFNPRAKHNEPRLIIRFHGKKLALACNKTQAASIERITGVDDYTKWPGHAVALAPGRTNNGQETIIISAAPKAPTPPSAETVNSNGDQTPAAEPAAGEKVAGADSLADE